MTAAKPLARYSATQGRARERLPSRPSYTIQWDTPEGSPAAPLRRLPAEAWALLRVPGDWWVAICRGEDTFAGSVVEVRGSPLKFFGVMVSAAAAQPRIPLAAVRLALLTAETEKDTPLTLREAERVGKAMSASRVLVRTAWGELRRRGG